jgi:hypothetical protein
MYPKSLSIDLTMPGNWIFTATSSSLPVGEEEAARVAVWTWPIEAAAKGRREKEVKWVGCEGMAFERTC